MPSTEIGRTGGKKTTQFLCEILGVWFGCAKLEVFIRHPNRDVKSAVGYRSLERSGAVRLGI